MKPKLKLLLSAFWLIGSSSYSQDFEEVYKAVASDRATMDIFGNTVSISGNYAIIGAHYEDEDTTGVNTLSCAGSAYIFERDNQGNWLQAKKITASDRALTDLFGFSVAISGSYCIVGALYEDEDTAGENTLDNAGSAYIFEKDRYGNWKQRQKIVASDRGVGDEFGYSVSISGNYAIVGALKEDEDTLMDNTLDLAGSAYLFERDVSGNWKEVQKIVASDRAAGDLFGNSVSISGNHAIVGAELEDEDVSGNNSLDYAGSAYIFERDGTGNWHQVEKIVASDRDTNAFFGYSVSVSGNYAIVGAYYADEDASGGNTLNNAGSAYLFERDGTGIWQQVQKIVASDRADGDLFGSSVSISGNNAVVGALMQDKDDLGGSPLADAGAAYIFRRNANGDWNEINKLVASDRAETDIFGNSTGISGDYVIVGALYEDEDASGENTIGNAGSAYIYESCTPNQTSDSRNVIENAGFETCILNPWVLYYSGDMDAIATFQLIDGTCIVSPSHLAASPELWHIQLIQSFSAAQLSRLEAGEVYNLSFDAWSEKDNRDCSVSLGMNEEPWTTALDEVILLNTSPETFSFDLTLDEVYSSVKLSFNTGTETSWAGFDNVKLMKKSELGTEGEETNSPNIWPNPATGYLHIMAESGSEVRLYNRLGMLVKKVVLAESRELIDIKGLPSGVYLVEIKQNTGSRIEKVIIE
jgi:hypothetical protein